MLPHLYIRKAKKGTKSVQAKPKANQSENKNVLGEQRGGNYVTRLQVGYTKDGKPRYRYFKTVEELERYRKWKNGDKAAKKMDRTRHERVDKLKKKTKKEDKHQSGVVNSGPGKVLSGPKTIGTEREKADTEVEKGLLFVTWR